MSRLQLCIVGASPADDLAGCYSSFSPGMKALLGKSPMSLVVGRRKRVALECVYCGTRIGSKIINFETQVIV